MKKVIKKVASLVILAAALSSKEGVVVKAIKIRTSSQANAEAGFGFNFSKALETVKEKAPDVSKALTAAAPVATTALNMAVPGAGTALNMALPMATSALNNAGIVA